VIAITKDRLRQAVFDYIVQSRTGDNTLSYTTTAAMSADDAADSSADRLWALLDDPQMDLLGEEVTELPALSATGAQFVVGEDLVVGQIATFDGDGRLVAWHDVDGSFTF